MSQAIREFEFTSADFKFICGLVRDRLGIVLTDAKEEMVYGRLARRLRKLGLTRFSEYCPLLERGDSEESTELANAITTNLTYFFREEHHFEHLAEVLIPRLLQVNAASRRIRIWSAGCSTGEEPYSIAMVLSECLRAHSNWDVRVLATDVDTSVLAKARNGTYSGDTLRGISKERMQKFFMTGSGSNQGLVKVRDEVKEYVAFKQLNLMGDWPMKGPFDVIFCRNVVIYFDRPTQDRLLDRYHALMAPGGTLFLGHSESITGQTNRWQAQGQTRFLRVD